MASRPTAVAVVGSGAGRRDHDAGQDAKSLLDLGCRWR